MTDHPSNAALTQNKLLLLRTRDMDEWQLPSLLEMMSDPDAGVRDWATFVLAARDDDGEEVRRALLMRARDSDLDARDEALRGLARRRDMRAIPLLIQALKGERVGTLIVEAAAYLARPELVAPLQALLEWWDVEPALLKEALARCSGRADEGGRCWDLVPANDQPS